MADPMGSWAEREEQKHTQRQDHSFQLKCCRSSLRACATHKSFSKQGWEEALVEDKKGLLSSFPTRHQCHRNSFLFNTDYSQWGGTDTEISMQFPNRNQSITPTACSQTGLLNRFPSNFLWYEAISVSCISLETEGINKNEKKIGLIIIL